MTTKTEWNNIFVDTNVLVGAYSDNKEFADDAACWNYLCRLKGKRIFISSLSIAQLVSVFQKKMSNNDVEKKVKNIIGKKQVSIIGFTKTDLEDSLRLKNGDMEDNIQYVLSKKVRCTRFVTNNTKDYGHFINLEIVHPKKIRTVNMD